MRSYIAITLVRAASALVSLAVRVQRMHAIEILRDDMTDDDRARLEWAPRSWREVVS